MVKSGILWKILPNFSKNRRLKVEKCFRGAAAVNLDAKGRVAIPTRYRAEIMEKNQGQMVCTVDIRQPCLLLYP